MRTSSQTENKPTKLPRFNYQVPADLTEKFLEEMKAEFRESHSATITAILRKHFLRKSLKESR